MLVIFSTWWKYLRIARENSSRKMKKFLKVSSKYPTVTANLILFFSSFKWTGITKIKSSPRTFMEKTICISRTHLFYYGIMYLQMVVLPPVEFQIFKFPFRLRISFSWPSLLLDSVMIPDSWTQRWSWDLRAPWIWTKRLIIRRSQEKR